MPRDQVFISYSHRDKLWLDDLDKHLKPFLRGVPIKSWSDQQIAPGSKWFDEIESALANTKVAVLLISPDFLASDFIHEHELGPLLKKADQDGVKILWVPIRDSAYKQTPLTNYQAVIDPIKPLARMNKPKRDQAWVKICDEIKKAVNDTNGSQQPPRLSAENYRKDNAPVWYTFPDGDKRLFYIAHIDVRNSRPDIAAPDCEIRLVRIYSSSLGERRSPDQNPLKVTTRAAYSQSIRPQDCGTFDLFGIDANSYPKTYLLNESDVARSPIVSTREKHRLTYEIFAPGFPKVTKEIELDLSGEGPHLDEATQYSSSGYPTTVRVISDPGQTLL